MFYKLLDLKNRMKWSIQRAVRGYDDRLHWDMAEYLDPMIVAQARFLRDHGVGYPNGITAKKWQTILNTIEKGMGETPDDLASMKQWKKYQKEREKALVLMAFYWDNLWD